MMPYTSTPLYYPQPLVRPPFPMAQRNFAPPSPNPYPPQAPFPQAGSAPNFQINTSNSPAPQRSFWQSLGKGALTGTTLGVGIPTASAIAITAFTGIMGGKTYLTKELFASLGKLSLVSAITGLTFGSLIGGVKGLVTSRPQH